jgi:hypothetical protein
VNRCATQNHPTQTSEDDSVKEWDTFTSAAGRTKSQTTQDLFDPPHIFLRIYAHRIERRLCYVDRHSVLEKPQLFEPFGTLKR